MAWDLATHWQELQADSALRFWILLSLRGSAILAGLAVPVVVLILGGLSRASTPRIGSLTIARGGAQVLLTAILVGSLVQWTTEVGIDHLDRFAVRSGFSSALLFGAGVWAAFLALAPRYLVRGSGGLRGAGRVLRVNLLLGFLLLETATRFMAVATPTRLIWNEHSIRSTIDANRLAPRERYLGFSTNSGGYYDQEFFRARPDDFVVAVVADSFGVGVVPRRYNFTTVVERRLAAALPAAGRIAVHNFGVASIGMEEYSWLIENEVDSVSPDWIVVGLFVGNDISELAAQRDPGHYSLQQSQLFELGRRLSALIRARSESGRLSSPSKAPPRRRSEGALVQATFAPETFLRIERAAVEVCNTKSRQVERDYQAALRWLSRLQEQAGARLLVLLIPDEYQVSDELYAELMRRVDNPLEYERFYPQRRLGDFCRRRGIELLDLLDPLIQANAKRPVYLLRDTHWNARGNRIAGEELARYLIERSAG